MKVWEMKKKTFLNHETNVFRIRRRKKRETIYIVLPLPFFLLFTSFEKSFLKWLHNIGKIYRGFEFSVDDAAIPPVDTLGVSVISNAKTL